MAKQSVIITGVSASACVLALGVTFVVSPWEHTSLPAQPAIRTSNHATYMAGCRTFSLETPPEKVYPTVQTNFRTWPCALEVPPPVGAIEMGGKRRLVWK